MGETIWVANKNPGDEDREIPASYRFFAYDLESKTRQSSKDIGELEIWKDMNNEVIKLPSEVFRGDFWLGERMMWVSGYEAVSGPEYEGNEGRIYTFTRPRPEVALQSEGSEDSTLKALRLSGVVLSPVFSPEKTYYTALVDHTVNSTTVMTSPNDSGAFF